MQPLFLLSVAWSSPFSWSDIFLNSVNSNFQTKKLNSLNPSPNKQSTISPKSTFQDLPLPNNNHTQKTSNASEGQAISNVH